MPIGTSYILVYSDPFVIDNTIDVIYEWRGSIVLPAAIALDWLSSDMVMPFLSLLSLLPTRFGGSYTVKLRVSGHSINQTAVVNFMTATFPGCYLKVNAYLPMFYYIYQYFCYVNKVCPLPLRFVHEFIHDMFSG